MGMAPPPKQGGSNTALIIIIAIAVLMATGLGGCLICVCIGRSASSSLPTASGGTTSGGNTPSNTSPSGEMWVTVDHPYVKFMEPPGWTKNIRNDWAVFKSPDGQAVFAFTLFNQPGESTARLGAAASILGVGEVNWRSPTFGTVGRDRFDARMGEGSCNFHGPGGYMWYATVNSGTPDQMLLIYTVSASGGSNKAAVVQSINSLQRR